MNTGTRKPVADKRHFAWAEAQVRGRVHTRFFEQIECLRTSSELRRAALQEHRPVSAGLGKLGEIYAEIEFGLRRHGTHKAGSMAPSTARSGRSSPFLPEKGNDRVLVKRQGDFEQITNASIDENFQFTGKLIDRSRLMGGGGRFLRARTREADGH